MTVCGISRLRQFLVPFAVLLSCGMALAQSDVPRETVAVTYPLDETINLKFRGTTLLPRLKGEAKVKRAGRRGTRIELSIDGLPRASELGGIYTAYVLWAISPDGQVDNLGEIKRSGSFLIDSKIDVTTPLQTFALLVTAEPHFLVKSPSRMVVLENLPPTRPGTSQIETVSVRYLGNSSDYFKDPHIPDVADKDYRDTPVSLLGARQAVKMAEFAGADQDAPDEIKQARTDLDAAEASWRSREAPSEIDIAARKATSSGAKAEEMAVIRRTARLRRDEIRRRDEAVRKAEKTAAEQQREIADLHAALDREQRARELAERDAASANEQLRDRRLEIARLRDELDSVRSEGDAAKIKLARIEGERQAEQARRDAEKREQERRVAEESLKTTLGQYGSVQATAAGFRLVLPESLWANPRTAQLTAKGRAALEPLAALLASNPDYQVAVECYTDSRGGEVSLQQLTQERAQLLLERFTAAGVDPNRIQANGMGASNPLASNGTVRGRARNRRVEITFTPAAGSSSARSQ
jgi:outer membrane protein OmpA-like peptidoglycan-associated protein